MPKHSARLFRTAATQKKNIKEVHRTAVRGKKVMMRGCKGSFSKNNIRLTMGLSPTVYISLSQYIFRVVRSMAANSLETNITNQKQRINGMARNGKPCLLKRVWSTPENTTDNITTMNNNNQKAIP